MAEVKQAMIRENSVKYTRRNDNSQQQSNNNESNVNNNKTSTTPSTTTYVEQKRGFINFSAAKERQKTKFAAGRARRRGDELLSMIRLDIVTFALFELPPIRYEDFMRTFGTSNMTQNSMQTGEDNLDEDIQVNSQIKVDFTVSFFVQKNVYCSFFSTWSLAFVIFGIRIWAKNLTVKYGWNWPLVSIRIHKIAFIIYQLITKWLGNMKQKFIYL